MLNNLELYYSINDLIADDNLFSLIQDYSRDSLREYKSDLWHNNENYGFIVFILEVKYDSLINYYTYGTIKILLKNNIYIEATYNNKGSKIDYLTNKLNIKSNIYRINNKIVKSEININIDFIIKDNKTYGIIKLDLDSIL